MELKINDRTIETDPEGYLVDLNDWTEELAVLLAHRDDVELTAAHWEIINMIRDFYQEYGTAPAVRALVKLAKQKLGDAKADMKYLYSLFPYGPGKQAARYAGLPKPTGCV